MTPRSFLLSPELAAFVRAGSDPVDDVVTDLVAETAALPQSGMQIAPDQGVFMHLLATALGARRAIEIGTFTGMSSIFLARGLGEGGSLLCLDRSGEWTAVARRYWERAGLADRIELRLGDAHETLRAVPAEPVFDLAFVDADKSGYADYVEQLHPRMRPNGVVLLDNTLRSGRVLAPESDQDRAVAELATALAADPRWETALLPLADGLTVLRKR